MVLAQRQKYTSMEQNRKPRDKSTHIWTPYLWQRRQEYTMEMDETGADYTEWSKPERKTPIQYTNAYIWNLERWQWWPYMRDSKRDTDIKNRFGGSTGESKGGMIWENSTETCILSYVKQIASPGLMHETGCSGLVHWDDPEGWDEERGGREGQDVEHMYTHGWFMWMYGKNHHNIVK